MASSNVSSKTILFKREKEFWYRIPSLLHVPNTDTLLAFAEKRLGPKDENADVLMLRKGTYKNGNLELSSPPKGCVLKDHRSMNPCPVYDKDTNTIFLLFIAVFGNTPEHQQIRTGKNVTRLCHVSSEDQGQTWSNVTDLTACTIGQCIKEWATFAVGPGHGTQLRSGRLIIPAYAYQKQSGSGTKARAFTFFSDDHGKTWSFGQFVSKEECGECQMVQVSRADENCILYCNARSNKHGKKQCRVQTFSTDGGLTFMDAHLVEKLVEPPNGCHGSIISFPQHHCQQEKNVLKSGEDIEVILFSHTTNSKSRKDLGIYLNTCPDSTHTWTEPWVINSGPSAYSELALVELPTEEVPLVACLYECGSSRECEQISFSVFQLDEVLQNLLRRKP
uniref:exo-alpha-sialidase n=1 Tax=Callorhinchus milii TaxID=7868 RepID=A0A4W3HLT2_CALMI